ncbi:MAG: hypothetical protein QW549_02705 [Candidatus Micrarchaeaceae archaeon]
MIALQLIMLQNSCISSVSSFLSSPYTGWSPIVTIAALAIFGILAIIYVLSQFLGTTNIRSWLRTKMLDVAFSVLLIVIFAAFATMICSINPVPAFTNADMTAAQCRSTDSLYGLALCNIYQFNQGIVHLNAALYIALLVLSLTPSVNIGYQFIPGLEGFGVSVMLPSPSSGISQMLSGVFTPLTLGEILNQLQLLIIASSLLIFASFMAIGLIARIFVISRSFGGTMIAFAMGIGFVYPLLVSITYGFINYQLTVPLASMIETTTAAIVALIISIVLNFIAGPAVAFGLGILVPVFSATALPYWLEYFGIFAIGLLFIPILNFIILDAFIVDFSRAVGEKIDFMSLLVNMI